MQLFRRGRHGEWSHGISSIEPLVNVGGKNRDHKDDGDEHECQDRNQNATKQSSRSGHGELPIHCLHFARIKKKLSLRSRIAGAIAPREQIPNDLLDLLASQLLSQRRHFVVAFAFPVPNHLAHVVCAFFLQHTADFRARHSALPFFAVAAAAVGFFIRVTEINQLAGVGEVCRGFGVAGG
jgi:hypothetical protein